MGERAAEAGGGEKVVWAREEEAARGAREDKTTNPEHLDTPHTTTFPLTPHQEAFLSLFSRATTCSALSCAEICINFSLFYYLSFEFANTCTVLPSNIWSQLDYLLMKTVKMSSMCMHCAYALCLVLGPVPSSCCLHSSCELHSHFCRCNKISMNQCLKDLQERLSIQQRYSLHGVQQLVYSLICMAVGWYLITFIMIGSGYVHKINYKTKKPSTALVVSLAMICFPVVCDLFSCRVWPSGAADVASEMLDYVCIAARYCSWHVEHWPWKLMGLIIQFETFLCWLDFW